MAKGGATWIGEGERPGHEQRLNRDERRAQRSHRQQRDVFLRVVFWYGWEVIDLWSDNHSDTENGRGYNPK